MKGGRILVLGGDARTQFAAKAFKEREVTVFSPENTLKSCLAECDAVLLGMPASRDDCYVCEPLGGDPILLKDLFRLVDDGTLILGGLLSERFKVLAEAENAAWADYAARREFAVLNAIPTAEGAIAIAMNELTTTLHGSKCAVLGYGCVGAALAKRLTALGARVTVFARSAAARAQAFSDNAERADLCDLSSSAHGFDVIFNSIPAQVIGRETLFAAKDALIIDLASRPGGVDMDAATGLGAHVIWALALPGKVAPETAGIAVMETVSNILEELGL